MSTSVFGTSALAQVAGLLTDFFEKLAGPEGMMWLAAFKKFLKRENPWTSFLTWLTLKVGEYKTVGDLEQAIVGAGCRISDWAADILKKIALVPAGMELELVNVSVRELGFKDGATREQIYSRAKELGFDLVPAIVGPLLRMLYKNQPMGEWLLMGMEPIVGSDGYLGVFSVVRSEGGLWLYAYYGNPTDFWSPEDRWVFARRK